MEATQVSVDGWMDYAKCIYIPWNIIQPFTRKEILTQATTWIKLEGVVLSEIVQSFSRVRLFATPGTAAHQASLSITNCQSPPKPMFSCSVVVTPWTAYKPMHGSAYKQYHMIFLFLSVTRFIQYDTKSIHVNGTCLWSSIEKFSLHSNPQIISKYVISNFS